MFDISWTEFLVIGVVALIVIGPKELPAVMRTLGQWTRKVRGMASEFQNQFQEAIREAEMADLKKEVDDLAQDVKNFDPLKDVRTDMETMSEDVKRSLSSTPEVDATLSDSRAEMALPEPQADAPPAVAEPAALAAPESPPPAAQDAHAQDAHAQDAHAQDAHAQDAHAQDAQAEPAPELETAAAPDAATAKPADAAESGTGRTG